MRIDPWLAEQPGHPEPWFMLAHYFSRKSLRKVPAVVADPPRASESLVLTDTDEHEVIGHMTVLTDHAPAQVRRARIEVDKAIAIKPKRLEFYMLKLYILAAGGLQEELLAAAREMAAVAKGEQEGL